MYRFGFAIIMIVALGLLLAAPVSAAEPVLAKRVVTEDDGTAVVIVEVRAADRAIYAVTITDDSGSITDIIAPKGWAGITSGDRVVFLTTDTPVGEGKTLAFKMVTTNKSASLNVTFRDSKTLIHSRQTI